MTGAANIAQYKNPDKYEDENIDTNPSETDEIIAIPNGLFRFSL
jgi:hypothetical protein